MPQRNSPTQFHSLLTGVPGRSPRLLSLLLEHNIQRTVAAAFNAPSSSCRMNTLLACRLGFDASTFHPPQHKPLMKEETRESTPSCRKHPRPHILPPQSRTVRCPCQHKVHNRTPVPRPGCFRHEAPRTIHPQTIHPHCSHARNNPLQKPRCNSQALQSQ